MALRRYDSILAELRDVEAWFAHLGLPQKGDRLRLLCENIARLEQARLNQGLGSLSCAPGSAVLTWALVEADDFIAIHAGLRDYHPPILLPLLRDAVLGPVDPTRA